MQIKEAIERITYESKVFPEEAFQVIEENFEEAKPYLLEAIEHAITEQEQLDKEYQLHFYALFFLGQFQEHDAFERITELVSLPPDVVGSLLGDLITEGLRNILYCTYNGNLKILEDVIENPEADEYVREDMLNVMAQLYLDGELEKEDWKGRLKEWVYAENMQEMHTWLAGMICECHFMDMLPEVRYLVKAGYMDFFVFGKYSDLVDIMFDYKDEAEGFCAHSVSVWDLKRWAMFADPEPRERNPKSEEELEAMWRNVIKELRGEPAKKKIGRNEPCPCGSGKKYKHCCLNKPKGPMDYIETEAERQRLLRDYPETGAERKQGRIYLEDYFDRESIDIDQRVYLAFEHRNRPSYNRHSAQISAKKQREYLWSAFSQYTAKMEKEGLRTNEEYDQQHSIHYTCREWLYQLIELLEDAEEYEKSDAVREYYKK